jgi:hypothetical protein
MSYRAVGYLMASFVGALLAVVCLFPAQIVAAPASGLPRFEAAHYEHDAIDVFPHGGKEFSIRLPPNVPATANLIGFALSGRSAYLQVPDAAILHLSDELIQVDFSPLRLFSVPGSGGLGNVISVTTSLSASLLVAASGGQGLCRAFEIDTSHGIHRPILTGSGCVFGVEPDGKRVLIGDNLDFKVVDAMTGAIKLSGVGRGAWSSDGKWLAISKKGEITVFDGRTFSVRRRFRASSVDGHLVWSPDSKRILFAQQELRCLLQDDFESIAVLDIETGKKWVISSSHCMVTNSQIGWVDVGMLAASTRKN